MHIDIPICRDVRGCYRLHHAFIIGEKLINLAIFLIRQTAKLKSSPNFPAIRYA